MKKFFTCLILGNVISVFFTFVSLRMVNFGFMGGQVYAGFPITLRLGYSPSLGSLVLVTLINGLVFMLFTYLITALVNLIHHKN